MSHSYTNKYTVKNPWEKLVVYLYARILSAGAVVGFSDSEWLKIVLDRRCGIDVDVRGDTESYEIAHFTALGKIVGIKNHHRYAANTFPLFLYDIHENHSIEYDHKNMYESKLPKGAFAKTLSFYLGWARRWNHEERDIRNKIREVFGQFDHVEGDKYFMNPQQIVDELYELGSNGEFTPDLVAEDIDKWQAIVALFFILNCYTYDMSC